MKKPIFNLCNRLWDIVITEDWKNQTDYPENTAKCLEAGDKVREMSVAQIADDLGCGIRTAKAVKAEFENGCDKWLAA